jgi:hypothetical protein
VLMAFPSAMRWKVHRFVSKVHSILHATQA